MDENYLDIVRKSLYKTSKGTKEEVGGKMPKKDKKIRFALDHYNSETVFQKKEKSDKAKTKKSKPPKKEDRKRKAVTNQNCDSSFEEEITRSQTIKNRKATPGRIPSKKRKLVISFSSDSFDEDVKDSPLSPSKSEMQFFQETFNKSNKRNNLIEDSDSGESISAFNLDHFFNTYEPSLNESITEAHSGIDNEFESDYVRRVNIVSRNHNDVSDDEEIMDEVRGQAESVVVISDTETNNVVEDITETDISEVATKIQEAIVLDDEESNPITISETSQHDVEYLAEYNAADYFDLDDCTLVVLKENQSISIYGLVRLDVLYGKLDIFGSILDRNSKEISLYSSRGSALLQLINLTTEDSEEIDIGTVFSSLALENASGTNKCAIIKCTKLEDFKMPFIEKYISQQIFPRVDNHKLPQVIFQPTGGWNIIKESYAWSEILNNVKPSTRLLFTGGKGVGKSTLLRFAINKLLNVFDEVRVIDLDPGQSEFAVPGCISVVTVKDFVFGPNYTHLKTVDRSLLSNINVGQDPRSYIKSVISLMTYCNTLEECPTLINYMGFAQGIGLNIISSVITYVQPTDIIQIHSKQKSKNFASDLTQEVVQENCALFAGNSASLEYNLHKIRAMNDDNEGWSLEPRQSREMCVLAYLGQMMTAGVNSLMSEKLPMYEVKLSSIKLTNPEGEEIPPAAINANLVALCSLEEQSNIFVCLGYGVVRGIDLETEKLVLLTPEAPSTLEKVSHLVLGNVNLPPSVHMTPDGIKGNIPYIMQGELISLGQITKRTYLPVNKKSNVQQ